MEDGECLEELQSRMQSEAGLILHRGNKDGLCLGALEGALYHGEKCHTVEIYNFLTGRPYQGENVLVTTPFQKRSIQACGRITKEKPSFSSLCIIFLYFLIRFLVQLTPSVICSLWFSQLHIG